MEEFTDIAPCRFCGMAVIVMDNSMDPGEYAARNCSCTGSKKYRAEINREEERKKKLDDAEKAINDLVLKGCENDETRQAAAQILINSLEPILDDNVHAVSVMCWGEKFKLSQTSKGSIKVDWVETRSGSKEV